MPSLVDQMGSPTPLPSLLDQRILDPDPRLHLAGCERDSDAILQSLPVAVYTTDAAGRITLYNEAAAQLWGVRPELGKSRFCGSWKMYWPDGTPLPHARWLWR
jgi:PAS domain-containing protein